MGLDPVSLISKALIDSGSDVDGSGLVRFCVPSAGAIYPYSIVIGLTDGRLLSADLPDLKAMLVQSRSAVSQPHALFLVYRPAASVAKYGPRGYVYGLQDCGHVCASVLASALAHGWQLFPQLHLDEETVVRAAVPRPILIAGFSFAKAAARPFCQANQDALLALFPDLLVPPPLPSAIDARIDGTADWGDGGLGPEEFQHGVRRRSSASSFTGAALDRSVLDAIGQRAAALARPWLGPVESLQLRIDIAARVAPDQWETTALLAPAVSVREPVRIDREALTGIFADQAFVAGGSAVIIMTAPKVEAARDTARNFFAGFLGQFFYLAAALEGISICCVGGFDYARLATAFRVADDRFPVYAMVLGRAGPDQLKVDRRRLPAERGLAPHMSTKPKGEHHAVL